MSFSEHLAVAYHKQDTDYYDRIPGAWLSTSSAVSTCLIGTEGSCDSIRYWSGSPAASRCALTPCFTCSRRATRHIRVRTDRAFFTQCQDTDRGI
jgi:hypothetical protein